MGGNMWWINNKVTNLVCLFILILLSGCISNIPPEARAVYKNEVIAIGEPIYLDASESWDTNGDNLTYQWTIEERPEQSRAELDQTNVVSPQFISDSYGVYIVKLIVNDGKTDSAPARVVVHVKNANTDNDQNSTNFVVELGEDQRVKAGEPVILKPNLSGYHGTLNFEWTILFSDKQPITKRHFDHLTHEGWFEATKPGMYVLRLTVRDSRGQVAKDAMVIWVDSATVNEATPWRQPLPAEGHAAVPNESCAGCHIDDMLHLSPESFKAPFDVRWHLEEHQDCGDCHSPTAWFPLIHFSHERATMESCVSCHNGVDATDKNVAHIATNDQCNDCHSTAAFTPVVRVNHGNVMGTCNSCHDGVATAGKPTTHLNTSDQCDNCHSTIVFIPAIFVDHQDVIGTCSSCHDGLTAMGKTVTHIETTDECDKCHNTKSFLVSSTLRPTVDHNAAIGECVDCHNGIVAQGKTASHITTTDICDACHATVIFMPVRWVDHFEVVGTCVDCHNGVAAAGKPSTHLNTSDQCDDCHTSLTFTPAVVVNHDDVIGTCSSCHDGVTAMGKTLTHIETTDECGVCHITASFRASSMVNHNAVIGTCIECHNGMMATGKTADHITTTDVCEACHTTVIFMPVERVDHQEVTGSCTRCHVAPQSHSNVQKNCADCHQASSWLNPSQALPQPAPAT